MSTRGLEIVKDLNRYRRAYYRWFADHSVPYETPLTCPLCGGGLVKAPDAFANQALCEFCSVALLL